eukprot:527794_1
MASNRINSTVKALTKLYSFPLHFVCRMSNSVQSILGIAENLAHLVRTKFSTKLNTIFDTIAYRLFHRRTETPKERCDDQDNDNHQDKFEGYFDGTFGEAPGDADGQSKHGNREHIVDDRPRE